MSNALDEQLKKLESLILSSAAVSSHDFMSGYNTSLMLTLKALLDCRDIPTWLKSTDGRVLYINPALANRYKVDPMKILGHLEYDGWMHPCVMEWSTNDETVLRTKKQQVFKEYLPSGDWIMCRKWVVQLNDEVIGVAGEVVDGSDTPR